MTAYIAAVSGGGVIVPLDRDLGHAEIARFADLSGAEAVFYTEQFNDVLPSLAEQMPQVRYFIPIAPAEGSDTTDGSSSAGDAVILPYSELLALGDKAMEEGDRSFLDYDCTADMSQMSALLFTSGTTGTSKGVMLSHANLVASVNAAQPRYHIRTGQYICRPAAHASQLRGNLRTPRCRKSRRNGIYQRQS